MRVLGTWGKQLRFVPGSEENGARGPWDKFEWCCVAEEAKGHGFHTDLVLSYGSGIVKFNLRGVGETIEHRRGYTQQRRELGNGEGLISCHLCE